MKSTNVMFYMTQQQNNFTAVNVYQDRPEAVYLSESL